MLRRLTQFFLVWLLLAATGWAALSANTVFEVEVGGSDANNSGGYVTGASGTDYSKQSSPQYSLTNGVTNGTTTVATVSASTDMIGNLALISGGTGSVAADRYQITAASAGVSITVDRSTGLTAGTGATINVGGALATPGKAASLMTVSGMIAWIKSGTYTLSTATAGAGGPISLGAVVALIEGYGSTRGDFGTKPIINAGSYAPTYIVSAANGSVAQTIVNIAVDGNGQATTGFYSQCGGVFKCSAINCTTGFSGNGSNVPIACAASYCTTGFNFGGNSCVASNCTTGLTGASGIGIYTNCISYSNATGGAGTYGTGLFSNCVFYNNSGSGLVQNVLGRVLNCVFVGNGAYGINTAADAYNCAFYSNTSGPTTSVKREFGSITLTADPFVNAAGGDFRPNNTAGGGAALRAAGIGVYGQTNNTDVGAVQHTDPSGGGGVSRTRKGSQ